MMFSFETHLHLSNLLPLPPRIALDRHENHVQVVLVTEGDHVTIGHVVVADLDLESSSQTKLVPDTVDEVWELDGGSDHDVPYIFGVHLDADFADFWSSRLASGRTGRHGSSIRPAIADHLEVTFVKGSVVEFASLVVLFLDVAGYVAAALLTAASGASVTTLVHVVDIVGIVLFFFITLALRVGSLRCRGIGPLRAASGVLR